MRIATGSLAAIAVLTASIPAPAQRRHRPSGTDSPAPASSAPESPQEAAARQHFEQGVALVQQARWADAVAELEQARALAAVPPVLYNLGVAHRALGHNLAAIEAFRAYLEATASAPPSPRRTEVEGFVTEMQARIGHIVLEITPPDASVLVDGTAQVTGTRAIDIDPGAHVVAVAAPRYRSRQERLQVPAGGTITVNFSLDRADVIQTGPPIGPIAVMGVGVLGLAAGLVFTIVRGNAFAAFERQHCDPPDPRGLIHCEPVPVSASDGQPTDPNYRLGLTMGYASLASYIAGGVVLAGGAAWLFLAMRARGSHERAAAMNRVVPVIAPGFVGFEGRF